MRLRVTRGSSKLMDNGAVGCSSTVPLTSPIGAASALPSACQITEQGRRVQATPSNDVNMEAHMSFCVNCRQPIVSINSGSDTQPEFTPWTHAFNGSTECDERVPPTPEVEGE